MDQAAINSYLTELEKLRLKIEDRLIHLPETSYLLERFSSGLPVNVQTYLHAIPVASSIIRSLVYSPRTSVRIDELCTEAGFSCPFDPARTGQVLTVFAFAYLYRRVARDSRSAEFAKHLSVIACLSSFDYSALQQVDWAVKALEESRKEGFNYWLAPAVLVLVQLTGVESPARARALAGLLEQYESYINKVWDTALNNQVYMRFPW